MAMKENEAAIFAHNKLADDLNCQLLDEEFKRLKELFRNCPLSQKDLSNIGVVTDLFGKLVLYEKISVGEYGFFTQKLKIVNPRLATEVERREASIKQMLNRGPSECNQDGARYESQQQTGSDQQVEVVPVEETKEGAKSAGTKGNFHRDERGLSFAQIEALGTSGLRKSVGIIKIEEDGRLTGSGTGFRVGRNYLMTAYHVLNKIIQKTWELAIRKSKQKVGKEATYQKVEQLFGISADQIKSCDIKPSQQPLPFGKLIGCLRENGVQTEVFDTLFKQAIRVEFGVKDGKATAGKFNFAYDIPFADMAHDVLVLQISEEESTLPPPLPLEKDSVRETGHLIGYPIVQTEVDLWSDLKCNIYTNNKYNELQSDVANAVKWWEDERKLLVEDDYAVVRKTNYSDNGRMFLHSAKEFEYRSSGSPIVSIIHDKPVVQLMYLRGYPEFCYAEKNFPPSQYLFEVGVAMPIVAQLLQESCPDIIET